MIKKMLMLLCCSCFFGSVSLGNPLNARVERAVAKASKTQPASIIRDAKDSLVLYLLGQTYTLITSEQIDSGDWGNVYLPEGSDISVFDKDDPQTDVIVITKATDTTCEDEVGDLESSKAYTFDTRNPNDQIVSGGDKTHYAVMRYVQVGEDVFELMVLVQRGPQSNEEWQLLQKNIFKATRNTAVNVLTDHFVEAACRFGSDCR